MLLQSLHRRSRWHLVSAPWSLRNLKGRPKNCSPARPRTPWADLCLCQTRPTKHLPTVERGPQKHLLAILRGTVETKVLSARQCQGPMRPRQARWTKRAQAKSLPLPKQKVARGKTKKDPRVPIVASQKHQKQWRKADLSHGLVESTAVRFLASGTRSSRKGKLF